ncbi:hypothetical protein FA15DRAFT_705840 [Coprinopsis marcescibilis]|uniref:Uncharacterized protein n=1 Tax=Coprinopsis marcescibilis TaxID=230819 RepID=A0A5C3KRG4_COPMA|nr:hypothetical protein FA15DRAFT_705840 [Coprinopsis marcescibilis]
MSITQSSLKAYVWVIAVLIFQTTRPVFVAAAPVTQLVPSLLNKPVLAKPKLLVPLKPEILIPPVRIPIVKLPVFNPECSRSICI